MRCGAYDGGVRRKRLRHPLPQRECVGTPVETRDLKIRITPRQWDAGLHRHGDPVQGTGKIGQERRRRRPTIGGVLGIRGAQDPDKHSPHISHNGDLRAQGLGQEPQCGQRRVRYDPQREERARSVGQRHRWIEREHLAARRGGAER